ncbi:MAG: ABC transporter permease [Stackebrandtia sp.]
MIWLTLRQHRAQILLTVGLLVVVGVVLLASGIEAGHYIAEHAPPGCPGDAAECGAVNGAINERYWTIYNAIGFLPIAGPALIGAFWGAPLLAREFERGTHKLIWTQSITPGRWLAVKIAVLAGILVASAAAFSAMTQAWLDVFAPAQASDSSFNNPGKFALLGVAPAAWWLFAFAVGVAAGAVFRRVIPAIAVTVAISALMFPVLVSMHDDGYSRPLRTVSTERSSMHDSGSILVSATLIDGDGETAEPPVDCAPPESMDPNSGQGQQYTDDCLVSQGYQWSIEYQPASRFWRYQWTEATILTTIAVALTALAVVHVRRRRI